MSSTGRFYRTRYKFIIFLFKDIVFLFLTMQSYIIINAISTMFLIKTSLIIVNYLSWRASILVHT